MIRFEWNSAKATANIKKHGITFEEAKSVFYDEFAVQFYDSENSELEEDRFLMLGLSCESRILIVCHCERGSGNTIRIISARKATSRERKYYAGDSS
ncbi:MAG: BrnT family toxin [Candidatus Thiodiazotropha endolucinida]